MRRTQTLGRIARIVAPALITAYMALLLIGCDLLTNKDESDDSPVVSDVTVWSSVSTVAKGGTLDFTATVYGTTGNVAQTVTWSVEGKSAAGTKIEEITSGGGGGGRLIVALDEQAQSLTVRATSTENTSKSGTATITITEPGEETVNKYSLIAAISAAYTAREGVGVDTAEENVPTGAKWVTQDEMTALKNAITAAETVKNNANATQTAVNDAVTALNIATTTFTNAIKTGTNDTIETANKSSFNTLITAANTTKSSFVVSVDGTDQIPSTLWVTQADLDTFNAAITAAETVSFKASATQAEVDAAITALTTAISTFTAAAKYGTKNDPNAADKTLLSAAITEANTAKNSAVISTFDGKDQAPGTKWVDSSTVGTLVNATTNATVVMANPLATQTEVDTAKTTLTAAIETFIAAIKIAVTTKDALDEAITEANTAKTGVATSTNGKDLSPGTKWVSSVVMTSLDTAINTAEDVQSDTAATQNAVDNAKDALNSSKTTFTYAIQTASTSKYSLDSAISDAESAKIGSGYGITVSDSDPGTGSKWVLPADMTTFTTAIDAAKDVQSDTDASQNEVDNAETTLKTATTAFNSKVKNVTHGTVPESKIAITLWENGSIASSSGSTSISSASNESFTAYGTSGYSNWQWYLNGVPIDGSTASSITIKAVDYLPGIYRLGVTAVKNSVPDTAEISFTVTD
jgi:hypothetical protein